MGKQEHKVRLWTGTFILVIVSSLAISLGSQSLSTGIPIYVELYSVSTSVTGILIFEFTMSASVARIIAGKIVDARGRKPVLVFGALFLIAGSLFSIFFTGVGPQFVLRLFQGVGYGCAGTAASTMAADVVPKERLGSGIGYYALGQSISMAIGPAFAVFLCSLAYRESLFVGTTAFACALLLCTLMFRYEKHPDTLPATAGYRLKSEERVAAGPQAEGSLFARYFEKRSLAGAVPQFVMFFAIGLVISYGALYANMLGLPNAGALFLIAAVFSTAVRLCSGSLLDCVKPQITMAICCVCGACMFIILAFTNSALMLDIAGVFFGLALGLCTPLLNGVAVKNTPEERWGAANALFYLAMDCGVGIGGIVWGAAAAVVGFFPLMLCGAALMAVGYAVSVYCFSKTKPQK